MELAALTMQVRKLKLRNRGRLDPPREKGSSTITCHGRGPRRPNPMSTIARLTARPRSRTGAQNLVR